MSDPNPYASYIRGKLREAVETIRVPDGRTMQEQLRSAYVFSLSSLQVEWFQRADRDEWNGIMAALTPYGEAMKGEGKHSDDVATMSDADAAARWLIGLSRLPIGISHSRRLSCLVIF